MLTIRSRTGVALMLYTALLLPALAHAAGAKYKVAAVRLWELQPEIDKRSKEGWKVHSITTSTQCSHQQPDGTTAKGECHVIIFERKD